MHREPPCGREETAGQAALADLRPVVTGDPELNTMQYSPCHIIRSITPCLAKLTNMGQCTRKRDVGVQDNSIDLCHLSGGPRPATSSRGPPREATLDTILQAIAVLREALELKIDVIATDLSVLRDDHHWLSDIVTTTE
ncbi:hypothetical protein NDU88_005144 [Pleurodeles waltl]|uniref:Uncharacterized protein n=1 Tax=Pleurodeles waltl TaxID=8319 RepID=A0AAV7SKT6_PLEWA|nr:hypothetical protein NDU88_005144 [Pleurodeles waltl]